MNSPGGWRCQQSMISHVPSLRRAFLLAVFLCVQGMLIHAQCPANTLNAETGEGGSCQCSAGYYPFSQSTVLQQSTTIANEGGSLYTTSTVAGNIAYQQAVGNVVDVAVHPGKAALLAATFEGGSHKMMKVNMQKNSGSTPIYQTTTLFTRTTAINAVCSPPTGSEFYFTDGAGLQKVVINSDSDYTIESFHTATCAETRGCAVHENPSHNKVAYICKKSATEHRLYVLDRSTKNKLVDTSLSYFDHNSYSDLSLIHI